MRVLPLESAESGVFDPALGGGNWKTGGLAYVRERLRPALGGRRVVVPIMAPSMLMEGSSCAEDTGAGDGVEDAGVGISMSGTLRAERTAR